MVETGVLRMSVAIVIRCGHNSDEMRCGHGAPKGKIRKGVAIVLSLEERGQVDTIRCDHDGNKKGVAAVL